MTTLHVTGGNTNGQLVHTLANTSWQPFFGDVHGAVRNSRINDPGVSAPFDPLDVASVQHGNQLNIVAISRPTPGSSNVGNNVFFTYRKSNGNWRLYRNLTPDIIAANQLPTDTVFTRVACCYQSDNHILVCILTERGRMVVFLIYLNNGRIININVPANLSDNVNGRVDVTCFFDKRLINSKLNIAILDNTGFLVRTKYTVTIGTGGIRLGTVSGTRSIIGNRPFNNSVAVAGTYFKRSQHYFICTGNGQLLYQRAGQTLFTDVNTANGGITMEYRAVDCTVIDEQIHVGAVGIGGVPYHTTYRKKRRNWVWQGFMGNISTQSTGSGTMTCIAAG